MMRISPNTASPFHALLLALLAPAAAAQIQHLAVEGTAGFKPGHSVAWVGDIDGDGSIDWATADTFHAAGGLTQAGQVQVHSGANGQLLGQFRGTLPNALVGWTMAVVGDVDGDGLAELAVMHREWPQPTRVLLVSMATFAPVLDFLLPTSDTVVLAGVGDVDGDGWPDLAVGAPHHPSDNPGSVWVHSGATGALLHALTPPPDAEFGDFGLAVAGAGDLDGDGRPEILVGAPLANLNLYIWNGGVYVFRGSDGALLREHEGGMSDSTGKVVEELGTRLASLSDVNGDGVPDYAAQSAYPGTQALLYCGATGALLHIYPAMGVFNFNQGLADAGDVDGDGASDLLISAGDGNLTGISLRSGAAPWELLDRFWLPYAIGTFAGGLDADGDGRPDLLLGEAYYLDRFGGVVKHHVGRTTWIGLHDLGAEVLRTCAATLNSTSEAARIWADGSLAIGDDACTLVAWNLPPDQPGVVFFGAASAQTPFGNGLLCVAPPTVRLNAAVSGSNGVLATPLLLGPSSPYAALLQPGVPAFFQCWFRDPAGGGAATDLSDAVRVTLVQ